MLKNTGTVNTSHFLIANLRLHRLVYKLKRVNVEIEEFFNHFF